MTATITHKAGDTFSWSLAYTDSSGNLVDLTGVLVDASFTSGPAQITIAGTVTDGPAGAVALTVSAATTAAWLPGLYQGDVTFGEPPRVVFSTENFALLVGDIVTPVSITLPVMGGGQVVLTQNPPVVGAPVAGDQLTTSSGDPFFTASGDPFVVAAT